MTLPTLLTYSLMASVWRQQLNILTPATSALWEGSLIGRFTRPMSILQSLAAETIGRWWVPVFLFYGLPVWLLSPLIGHIAAAAKHFLRPALAAQPRPERLARVRARPVLFRAGDAAQKRLLGCDAGAGSDL